MDNHNPLTESEEMYLVTIAKLLEDGAAPPVPVSNLAQAMNIAAVSANQMVRKLEECELVHYSPYKGVSLTVDGELAALRVLRHRRLWEVFLVEHLGFPPSEAEIQACRVEHVFPDETIERLAAYLGHPAASPNGRSIPAPEEARLDNTTSLSRLHAGQTGQIRQIGTTPAGRVFLAGQGLNPGTVIKVLASTQAGDMLVVSGSDKGDAIQTNVHLSAEMAAAIKVIPIQAVPNPTHSFEPSKSYDYAENKS